MFEDDEEDLSWWHKPELSVEKKKEKMRAAERDVKFKLSNKKFLQKKQTMPYNRNYHKSDNSFGSFQHRSRFPNPRPDSRKCNWCQGFGHIATVCPLKFHQHQQHNRSLPQINNFSQGNGKTAPMGN